MKRSYSALAVRALVLCMMVAAMSGCSGTKKHWWEFWKRPAPRMFPTDSDTIPPPPGTSPLPGDLGSQNPDRNAQLQEVPDLQTVYFNYDSSELSSQMQATLQANAEWIKGHSSLTVQIAGHCDERGSTEYNLNLGQKRADTVREFLVGLGIPAERLVTISYGKERPVDPSQSESAYSKNRRVQFLVY